MSWGYKISLLYIGFVAFMIFMVIKSVRQDFYMVRDDYYEADLSYQDKYEQMENAAALQNEVQLSYDGEGNLVLNFPEAFAQSEISGKIHLYRPSNGNLDQHFEIQKDADNSQIIPAGKLQSGLWELRMECQTQEKAYYFQKDVVL